MYDFFDPGKGSRVTAELVGVLSDAAVMVHVSSADFIIAAP
jgi:hypothetical protein